MYTHMLNEDNTVLCKTLKAGYWTKDPQAVDCPKCIDRMDLQPA